MRGGILDLASPGSPSGPVRLELFGDQLDSVRPLDILNQRSSGNLEEVYVFPAHEIVLKDETRYNLRQALKDKLKAAVRQIAVTLGPGGPGPFQPNPLLSRLAMAGAGGPGKKSLPFRLSAEGSPDLPDGTPGL